MLKAQEILSNFKTFRANWIAKDADGSVFVYRNKPLKNEQECVWQESDDNNCYIEEIPFDVKEFAKDARWEECLIEREKGYDTWVGKLCWFWELSMDEKILGILGSYNEEAQYPFYNESDSYDYSHCYPVSRDEVEFLE